MEALTRFAFGRVIRGAIARDRATQAQVDAARRVEREEDRLDMRETLLRIQEEDPEYFDRQVHDELKLAATTNTHLSVASAICGTIAVVLMWNDHLTGRWIALAVTLIVLASSAAEMYWNRTHVAEFFVESQEAPDWIGTSWAFSFFAAFICLIYALLDRL